MREISVSKRNENAKKFISDCLERAEGRSSADFQKTFTKELAILEYLIPIKQMGFRGIVLTAITGKYLDRTFRPLQDFYGCNPRSIFENGIRHALRDAKIPCGKSDPLNVAKNQKILDKNWAIGRRPESAAMAVVEYLGLLERAFASDKKRYRDLIDLFCIRLSEYAASVRAMPIDAISTATMAPLEVGRKLSQLVISCPEAGAVPQFIVGQLLALLRSTDRSIVNIGGLGESVFGTNTTSNKPADLWEVRDDGGFENLYEVTVKSIDKNRLDDCVDNVIQQGLKNYPVTFVCDMPSNIEALKNASHYLNYRGISFQFVDIRGFIESIFALLSRDQRAEFLRRLLEFMGAHDRPVRTKLAWAAINEVPDEVPL
jgi:hypothetical protein